MVKVDLTVPDEHLMQCLPLSKHLSVKRGAEKKIRGGTKVPTALTVPRKGKDVLGLATRKISNEGGRRKNVLTAPNQRDDGPGTGNGGPCTREPGRA